MLHDGKYYKYNGSIYEGDLVDNQPHGKGKMIYFNKTTFEGEFRDGERDGNGIFMHKHGKITKGRWKNDNCVEKFDS